MKYKIFEELLTEYTGNTQKYVLLEEIEASSHAEANRLFRQYNPNKENLRISDDKTAQGFNK